jgi:hypothetical protein
MRSNSTAYVKLAVAGAASIVALANVADAQATQHAPMSFTPVFAPAVSYGGTPDAVRAAPGSPDGSWSDDLPSFVNCALGTTDGARILRTAEGSREERRSIQMLVHNNLRCAYFAEGYDVRTLRLALTDRQQKRAVSLDDVLSYSPIE